MSTRTTISDELLHEALGVPSGVVPPFDLVEGIMAGVVATPPRRPLVSPAVPGANRVLVPILMTAALLLALLLALVLTAGAPAPDLPAIGKPVVIPFTSRNGAAAFGSLWLPVSDGSVARLDPATLEVISTTRLTEPGGSPPDTESLTAAEDGIWVALAADRSVALLDGATGTEIRRVPIGVNGYALAADGLDLWVTDFEHDTILRIDRATGVILATITGIDGPTGVAVGEGGVWVVANGSGRLVRIDPATSAIAAHVINIGRAHKVAVGFGGVWTANGRGSRVSRVDPATNEVVATIPLPGSGFDIEAVGDSMWVTSGPDPDCSSSVLSRIDPSTNAIVESLPFDCAWALITDGQSLWLNGDVTGGPVLAPVNSARVPLPSGPLTREPDP